MEIVKINLENELDLILSHKRSMKLAELCGLSLITQTSFATAVSEISRCVIAEENDKPVMVLGINIINQNKKELYASITSIQDFEKDHVNALRYAQRLADSIKVIKNKKETTVLFTQKINFSGLINDAKLASFIDYFKKELPISPYDELRKKNIQLLEVSEKLRESENQYKMLTETLPLMIFTTNTGGHLSYGNKWLKDFFSLGEIQPGKLHWLTLLDSTSNSTIRDEWEKTMLTQSNLRSQGKLRSKNNEEALWHLISLMPIKNELGQIGGWTGFFVDIQAQKLVEETLKNNVELKNAQKQLLNYQTKLEEKVQELNKSNHDLEQFAYIASHDLQEPLRKIRSFSDLLERNLNDHDKVKKYIGKIDASSSRMVKLINDVLNYSRLSKAENNFITTDLNEIVNNVKMDIELLIEERNVVIRSTKLPSVNVVPQQIHQLFYNLLNNSIKFCDQTPVISISHQLLPENKIAEYTELHPNVKYVELKFTDNGIGFEQKYAKQIFTIFKRLNSKDNYQGTGIGLALCKKIVDNHHGVISAESETGKGTTFRVILPLD